MNRLNFYARDSLALLLINTLTSLGTTGNAASSRVNHAVAFSISLLNARAQHVAKTLRELYPRAKIRYDPDVNALVVVTQEEDVPVIRVIVTALDVPELMKPQSDIVQLTNENANIAIKKLHPLYAGSLRDYPPYDVARDGNSR